MLNQPTRPQSQSRPDNLEELCESLGTSHRLVPADKPIFARNLGNLAARLCPNNPIEGARLIVMHSGNESLWPTKRKKYFRLPGEDAPPAGKNGDYASYPAQFRRLAEAAAELLCKSNKPEAIKRWKQLAIKSLVTGSSFMPSFVATDVSDLSAKALLDEYATVLAEAVKSRTKITQLWEILQTTSIRLKIDEESPSPYGDAANFPRSLLTPLYRESVTSGHLTTSWCWTDDEWSKPCLSIGSVSFPVRIRMFCIPEDKRHLFPANPAADSRVSSDALKWLQSAGFDVEAQKFPSLAVGEETCGWKNVHANIFVKVGLQITHDGDAEPKVEICLWGDLDYAAHPNPETQRSNVAQIAANPGTSQHWGVEVNDEYLEAIYDTPFSRSGDQEACIIGLLPSCWQMGSDGVEWTAPTVWLDGASAKICDEVYANNFVQGWTDEEFIAKLLMGEGIKFHPLIAETDPAGGVLPPGSIGAGLLQNSRSAAPANRITQLLIEKVALTADTGIRFYEAMVDDFRSAIHRI